MVSIGDMSSKGRANLSRKIPGMAASFAASAGRAKANYGMLPFGPTRKRNYESAWATMPGNYSKMVGPGMADKWARNWAAKMAE